MLEKSRRIPRGLETVLFMGALALALCLAAPRAVHAQNLQIFAANPLSFGPPGTDDNEVTATCDNPAIDLPGPIPADPVLFYDNTVTTTAAIDVMLVTISATGDADGGNRLEIQCKVDGTPCKTGNIGDNTGVNGPPRGAGWVSGRFSDEDEIISYTWCVPITKTKKNEHKVNLSLANGHNVTCPNDVTLEQVNVFVEGYHAGASKAAQACKSVGVGEHSS